jgi:YcxB-like protein
MEVRFDLLPEDLAAFARYRAKQPDKSLKGQLKSTLLALLVVLHFGVVFLVMLHFAREMERDVWRFGGLIIGVQLGCWAATYFFVLGGRLRPRANLKKGHEKDIRLAIAPDWFRYANRFAETGHRWNNFDKIAITDSHTFFFTSATGAYLLPRRAFADKEAYFEFAQTAQRYFDAAKSFKDNPYEDVT